jgi:hypothetical protein
MRPIWEHEGQGPMCRSGLLTCLSSIRINTRSLIKFPSATAALRCRRVEIEVFGAIVMMTAAREASNVPLPGAT